MNALVSQRRPLLAKVGKLRNTTFIAKDNITTTEEATACGLKMLKTYVSPFDATVVRLLQKEGLVLFGKANMDEFGMGLSNLNSHFGPTLNPRFPDPRIPGGLSGGSAAAVAAGLADFALGTDTGGSVRQPASYCGVIGFKPSYGRISRFGVVAYAQGFDTVGVLAKSVQLTRQVFDVLNHFDENDVTSLPDSIRENIRSQFQTKDKLVIGIPQELLLSELSSDMLSQFESILSKLIEKGHTVRPVSLPTIKKLLSAYYTLATAEAASNLARFDGVRYGHNGGDIFQSRIAGFGEEVQRRIVLGNYTLSAESGDHYKRATHIRQHLVEEFNDVFAFPNVLVHDTKPGACDVLLSPTAVDKAPLISDFQNDTEKNFVNGYVNDILTIPMSMGGLPAISVPCADADFGVQIVGQYGHDELVLDVATVVEAMARASD